jgi:hypothetical protein
MAVNQRNEASREGHNERNLDQVRLRQIPIHEIDIDLKLGDDNELLVARLKELGWYGERYGFCCDSFLARAQSLREWNVSLPP